MIEPFDYLFALEQFGIKFGLDNIRSLLAELGDPQRAFRSIHIAGTNGKGSVTALADHALRAAGHRSARYTSPHLVDLSERFVIDGCPVDRSSLASAISLVRETAERLQRSGTLSAPPTFFEATTAVAFELFRRAKVEIAVCEVGLGGRLDATNVLEPTATAITTIAFDHQQYLGTTLESIAAEKAGIIKPHTPVVVGAIDAPALTVIEAVARQAGAEVVHAFADVEIAASGNQTIRLRTPQRDYGTIGLALPGRHQVANGIVAVRLLETLESLGIPVPASAIADALAHVSWPGRIDIRRLADGREVLMDAAHNAAGAEALAAFIRDSGWMGAPLVFTAMKDKDVDDMLRALIPVAGRIVFTRASNARSAAPEELLERARRLQPSCSAATAESPAAALAAASAESSRVVIAGSIFLLGDVLPLIESRDTLPVITR